MALFLAAEYLYIPLVKALPPDGAPFNLGLSSPSGLLATAPELGKQNHYLSFVNGNQGSVLRAWFSRTRIVTTPTEEWAELKYTTPLGDQGTRCDTNVYFATSEQEPTPLNILVHGEGATWVVALEFRSGGWVVKLEDSPDSDCYREVLDGNDVVIREPERFGGTSYEFEVSDGSTVTLTYSHPSASGPVKVRLFPEGLSCGRIDLYGALGAEDTTVTVEPIARSAVSVESLVLEEGAVLNLVGPALIQGPITEASRWEWVQLHPAWSASLAGFDVALVLGIGLLWARSSRKRGEFEPVPPLEAGPFDVFLSYNSKDGDEVAELAGKLRERGIKVWLDNSQLMAGQEFQEHIEKAILSCRTTAVLLGRHEIGPWQKREMRMALLDRTVIPVLLSGAEKSDLPRSLRILTTVDLSQGLTSEGLDLLVRSIQSASLPSETDA